jgi:hypothetical protein
MPAVELAYSRSNDMTTTDERLKEDLDPRLREHLETQLRDANATNHDLRTRIGEAERNEQTANARAATGVMAERALEQAHAKQKAAEDEAAVARRKLEAAAELELVRARGEVAELRERLSNAEREADRPHGFLFQHHQEFAADVLAFLGEAG